MGAGLYAQHQSLRLTEQENTSVFIRKGYVCYKDEEGQSDSKTVSHLGTDNPTPRHLPGVREHLYAHLGKHHSVLNEPSLRLKVKKQLLLGPPVLMFDGNIKNTCSSRILCQVLPSGPFSLCL